MAAVYTKDLFFIIKCPFIRILCGVLHCRHFLFAFWRLYPATPSLIIKIHHLPKMPGFQFKFSLSSMEELALLRARSMCVDGRVNHLNYC